MYIIFIVVLFVFGVFVLLSARDRAVLTQKYKYFDYDGKSRRYLISESKLQPQSIIVGLHGFGDSARRFAYYTALHNTVDEHTMVVYPLASDPTEKGMGRGWNSGFCCGSGWVNGVDDVGFLMALIDNLKEKYNVKSAQVFITGFSNGAFMTQRVAAEQPNKVTAAASVAGAIGTAEKQLEPTNPIPILFMHGKKDRTVPFAGGAGGTDSSFIWLSHEETVEKWQKINQSAGVETKDVVYELDGHKWHGWRIANLWQRKPAASREIIDFFKNH